MRSVFNPAELKEQLTIRENRQYRISPTDPYNLIDSVFSTQYPSDSIARLVLLNNWHYTESFGAKTTLVSIAPALEGWYGNNRIYLPHGVVFWAKWNDILPYFTQTELDFYQYLFFNTLKKSVGGINYQYKPLGDKK